MTFLPIVERELRVAARRRGTYGMRMKIAGAATLAFAACFVASQITPSVPFGKTLFLGLSGLCLIYCLAAGRLMTADCLSREKREGTLGLLFLTDLKGYDVVLGKLAATSLDGFYGLMAVFPLLAIPLLAGGMTNGELWRTALVLVNTFLFSLAVGLFVSAVCRDEQKAMAGNFGLLLLLAAVPPAIDGMIMMSGVRPHPMTHEFFYSCPVYSFWQCADVEYNKSPGHFWRSIGMTFNLTLLLVLLACRVAPRAWQDKPLSPRSLKQKGSRRWRWWREGRLEKARAFRRRLLDVNAYFWLAARPYLKVSYVWTCMLCMGIWWVFTTMIVGHNDEAVNFAMAFIVNGMLKLWIITEAGRQFAEDKRSGAFELLLSTPLSVGDIARAQWLALRRQFLKPAVAAVILELVLMFSIRYIRQEDRAQAWSIWLAGILMFLADMLAVSWFAMSAALTAKNHDRATLKTAAFILALPWLLFAAVKPATSLWIILISRKTWEPEWTYYLGWWFGLGISVDLLFLVRARRRVLTRFRQLALESLSPKSHFDSPQASPIVSPERKPPLRAKLRRLAIVAVVVLAAGAGAVLCVIRSFHVNLPDPVVVSLSQSNQPPRVFSGQGGFLFILPDGTLWRWVHPSGQFARLFQPEQVGTNRDWVQASVMFPNAVAVRSDGTLWAWAVLAGEPTQIDSGRDWVEGRAGGNLFLARKRDGTLWGRGDSGYLGNGPIPRPLVNGAGQTTDRALSRSMRQVGTNHDWKAINAGGSSAGVLGLRADGTLWTWGDFNILAGGTWFHTNNPFPIQVCRETNWVSLSDGAWSGARNQAGEWWSFYPFSGIPGANVPVSAIGQLASSNSAMAALGPVFNTNWSFGMYDLQPGGKLWATPLNFPVIPSLGQPFPFGQRSDWISVWGGSGTLIGLTSDGTMWTWGLDYGQERHYDFGERLDLVKTAISNAFSARPMRGSYDEWQGHQGQKEPRPLLRLTLTNSEVKTATPPR
jgi:ABC-type transport system involved in multi-copper enzyme maturation permease subunit